MNSLFNALLIGNIANHFLSDIRRSLKLNETQFWIVHLMGDQDESLGLSARMMCPLELAKASALPATRIVSQLDALVKAKTVRKVTTPKTKLTLSGGKAPDARRQYYQLTYAGVTLARRQAKILKQVNRLLLIAMPVSSAAELDRCARLFVQESDKGALAGARHLIEALRSESVKPNRRDDTLDKLKSLRKEDLFWRGIWPA